MQFLFLGAYEQTFDTFWVPWAHTWGALENETESEQRVLRARMHQAGRQTCAFTTQARADVCRSLYAVVHVRTRACV